MIKKQRRYLFFLFLLSVLGTTYVFGWPWSSDLWEQISIQPYEMPLVYPNSSVSTDGAAESGDRLQIEEIAQNPAPVTKASMEKGESLFNTFCAACHGMGGKGDGPVIKRGFYPLDLTSPGIQKRTDGYIYAYIRYGGRVMMPSYRESITTNEAWDVVHYVRKLQGKLNLKEESAE